MGTSKGKTVKISLGDKELDSTGSAIGAARMNPADAYRAIPLLLQEYINSGSESSWSDIIRRIDNIYLTVSNALDALESEVSFSAEVKKRVNAGQKLFFKPNLVTLPLIDYVTHGPGLIGTCTPWEFLAAVMRWFHDRLDISYHRMTLGEAGTATPLEVGKARLIFKDKSFNTQALLEGKSGDNYGGWGFYFARKYLAERHNPDHTDDPMSGYEESISGARLPAGRVSDKLLIYDISKIADDFSNGREVPVANGINFKSITLHKSIIGGDPADPQDISDWPRSVLVNIGKLKVHQSELFTSALKNLGMGLYPQEANASKEPGKCQWKYSVPPRPMPCFKMGAPHARWICEVDEDTGLPLRDKDGKYIMRQTGGMQATIADAIQAVKGQGIMMLHVVDAIETANINHSGQGCVPVPEGFVFASTDPVAVDVLGARYLFTMVPMAEVDRVRREYHLASDVIQKVPLPRVGGNNIVTGSGFDSSFSRYYALKHCEQRGLGQQHFHVVGNDLWHGGNLASVNQHLGRVKDGTFTELLTGTMYHAIMKPLWDLQATCLAYLEANDRLTGSNFKQTVLDIYDENGDGVLDYLERGVASSMTAMAYSARLTSMEIDPLEALRLRFLLGVIGLRMLRREWNVDGHDIGERGLIPPALVKAFAMSKAAQESQDHFFPDMSWGKGKWPSLQYALHLQLCTRIYGQMFPSRFDTAMAPYGLVFRYADIRWNGTQYSTAQVVSKNEDTIGRYHTALAGGADPLPFVLYVPEGFASNGDTPVPNVEETDNPALIFTARFDNGEVWKDIRLSSIP